MINSRSYACFAVVAAVALVAGGSVAKAEMVKMKAPLSASTEVPPNNSKGSGNSDLTYDTTTKKLQWTIPARSRSRKDRQAVNQVGPVFPADKLLSHTSQAHRIALLPEHRGGHALVTPGGEVNRHPVTHQRAEVSVWYAPGQGGG